MTVAAEPLPRPDGPPGRRATPGEWTRANLFYSPWGTLLTVASALVVAWAAFRVGRFVLASAEWEIVRRNLTLFMVWRFPRDELWRLWAGLFLVAITVGVAAGARAGAGTSRDGDARATAGAVARRWWPALVFAAVIASLVRSLPPVAGMAGLAVALVAARAAGARLPARARRWTPFVAAAGILGGYQLVARAPGGGVDDWGGLLITLYLAAMGIVISFPLGVALALGRRSSLPAVRAVSTAYIELFRGVPLVAVLYMGYLLLGYVLPPGSSRPGIVARALTGFVLFTAAYLAEIVRGGLQSVPRGQVEAAHALGLSTTRTTALIVLPQALRAVIPATVGQFISLFKDTSLVVTIGIADLLTVAQTVTKQPDFLGRGLHAETLVFVSFVYWVGSYTMSRAAHRLERRLGVGER